MVCLVALYKLNVAWRINSVVKLIIFEFIVIHKSGLNVLVVIQKAEHIIIVAIALIFNSFNAKRAML